MRRLFMHSCFLILPAFLMFTATRAVAQTDEEEPPVEEETFTDCNAFNNGLNNAHIYQFFFNSQPGTDTITLGLDTYFRHCRLEELFGRRVVYDDVTGSKEKKSTLFAAGNNALYKNYIYLYKAQRDGNNVKISYMNPYSGKAIIIRVKLMKGREAKISVDGYANF